MKKIMDFKLPGALIGLLVALFYIVNSILTILLYLGGTHEFYYLAAPLNGLVLAWVVLAPATVVAAWIHKRYVPIMFVLTVVGCFFTFWWHIVPSDWWRHILPSLAIVFSIVPFFEILFFCRASAKMGNTSSSID